MNGHATRRRTFGGRTGMTLLEILLAVSLLALLAYQGLKVFTASSERTGQRSAELLLQDQAQIVLERVARAIMSSTRETLLPDASRPLSSDDIEYRIWLGVENGEVVWSDPEQIGLEDATNEVYWTRIPEDATPQRVVWTDLVRPFLEGEVPNGMDDNGNGLIDEKGLCFTIDRNAVTIRLTLDRVTADGRPLTQTVETTVTCRNLEPQVTP